MTVENTKETLEKVVHSMGRPSGTQCFIAGGYSSMKGMRNSCLLLSQWLRFLVCTRTNELPWLKMYYIEILLMLAGTWWFCCCKQHFVRFDQTLKGAYEYELSVPQEYKDIISILYYFTICTDEYLNWVAFEQEYIFYLWSLSFLHYQVYCHTIIINGYFY